MTVPRMDNVGIVLEDLDAELVGEVAQYEDIYRLCYLRGPQVS